MRDSRRYRMNAAECLLAAKTCQPPFRGLILAVAPLRTRSRAKTNCSGYGVALILRRRFLATGKQWKSHEHLRLLPRPHRLLDARH
jgi:hypothetical protein